MEKKYISTDIESSGSAPGIYNMLSIGACVAYDKNKQFYRELKPITKRFDLEAMQVGCLGLKCLYPMKNQEEYDPTKENFNPKKVLELLQDKGEDPKRVIQDFGDWVIEVSKDYEPILTTDVQPFDGSFIMYYFAKYLPRNKNPFGHKGINIDLLYKGITKNIETSLKGLNQQSHLCLS